MLAFRAVFLFISIIAISAVPTPRSPQAQLIHEQIAGPPDGFVHRGPAPDNSRLELRIALKSNAISSLEETLYNVSTPGHPSYGKHLNKRQVEAFVAPSKDTKVAVDRWLRGNGIKAQTTSSAGDWLKIDVSVSEANDLLGANFSTFTHEATGSDTIRTLQYFLPVTVKDHINAIHPTVVFPPPSNKASFVSHAASELDSTGTSETGTLNSTLTSSFLNVSSVCDVDGITPICIQTLYGLPPKVDSQNSTGIAVSGFVGQFAQQEDLSFFLEKFRPDISPTITFSLETVDGGENIQAAQDAGIEANIDVQWTTGLAPGVDVTFISAGPNNTDGLSGFLDLANFLLAQSDSELPKVLTTSYTFAESTISVPLAQVLCNGYMQLGARGVSIFFASGDGGVFGGVFDSSCSDSQVCNTTLFSPTFPSTCPFVTSVGSTVNVNPEIAASFSSGGFSNIFPVPSYQQSAVGNFLKQLGDTNAGLFNRTGRGFPDIAAQGQNILCVNEGTVVHGEFGTSFSSPMIAGIIGLLNALRMQEGKPPLGFLNPLIYSTPEVFTDITSGNSSACGCEGFAATTGWDPVTGHGTPIFEKLKALP